MSSSRARDIEALRATVAQLAARLAVLEHQVRRPTDPELLAAIADATKGRAFSAVSYTVMLALLIPISGRSYTLPRCRPRARLESYSIGFPRKCTGITDWCG